MRHCSCALWLVVIVLPAVGCGKSTYEVSGNVTCDGQPLKEGDILFVPENPKLGPDAGKIVDGHYQFQAQPGKMRVQITANRIIPGKVGMMGEPVTGNYLPERYNEKTELRAEVGKDSPNHFDFDLHTDEKD